MTTSAVATAPCASTVRSRAAARGPGAVALRVALLAGSLTQGGAEKQLVYMARALRDCGAAVRLYSLTDGEFYQSTLEQLGLPPLWIGRTANPLLRVLALSRALRRFRPHVLQAGHFFTNLHVTLAARIVGAQAIGSLRNDATFEVRENGAWGRWLLRLPPVLLANSHAAVANAARLGASPTRIHVVSNVVDLEEFDARMGGAARPCNPGQEMTAMAICRLVPAKRVDRFLQALAAARGKVPQVRGVIVGDGPERRQLERRAEELGLGSTAVQFLGRRDDVPALLRRADVLVVSSDHEGFPNVVLEAMSARLPVVTTPAGDAGIIVRDGQTGFVVPFDDVDAMASRLTMLAAAPGLRRALGNAGRADVEDRCSISGLGDRLLQTYSMIAGQRRNARLQAALARSASEPTCD